MRKLLFIIFAVTIASPSFSQVKFGIQAGANTSTVPTYDFSTGTSNVSIEALKDAQWGFNAGVFLRAQLGPIFLQPEITFTSNTYEYNVTENSVSDVVNQKWNRLEIPLLVGIKLGPIRLNAGPSATVPIGSPENLVNDPNFDDMYSGTTFGYQAGVGLDIFNRITLDARYGGSLADEFGDSVTIGDQSFKLDQRQPYFGLSIGIIF